MTCCYLGDTRASLIGLRNNAKILFKRPASPALPDHLDRSAAH